MSLPVATVCGMTGRGQAHYRGDYARRAAAVRAAAYADPGTRCWRCGLTLAEAQERARPGKVVRWHAGHTVDGSTMHALAPEHSTCNMSAGGRLGRSMQLSRHGLRTTRNW